MTADVLTEETTTSPAYSDLATTGPTVTKSMVNGQTALVIVSCIAYGATDGDAFMSFAVSGALTLAASDANGAKNRTNANDKSTISRVTVITATSTATATVTAKYKATSAASTTFGHRRIIIKTF